MTNTAQTFSIRHASADDQQGILDLIDEVYHEYGDRVCPQGAEADVLDIQASYVDRGGAFWVLADSQSTIVGTHAAFPKTAKVCGFRRLYLRRALRGGPWGPQLMNIAIDWARERGFSRIEFWSDSRFTRAHAFFAKFGFSRDGRMRTMRDGHQPYREYCYRLDMDSEWAVGPLPGNPAR